MSFPELTPVKSDKAWPLVRLSANLKGGKIHVSFLCDKHTANTEDLVAWLSGQHVKGAHELQSLKHKIYHELMPKALQLIFQDEQSSLSTREIQPGAKLPESLEILLNDELTKRTIF
jgi:hypothetical protein